MPLPPRCSSAAPPLLLASSPALPSSPPKQLLRSEDSGVHYEAVGVLGNLVHSSQHVKLRVRGARGRDAGGCRYQPKLNRGGRGCYIHD